MRPGVGFNGTAAAAAKAVVAPAAAGSAAHSAWHSPVPYLFGGLAAMLGLIAFALLILACSYWKLSGYLEGGAGRGDEDGSGADSAKPPASDLPPPIWEEKILVIMAGDVKPTYLATPMSSRASSFGDRSSKGEEDETKKVQEVSMASIKDAENGEHSESRREREEHHIPEV
ncbi:protein GLUTAMINE DUMPER 2-like [Phragmites australis]|uniref:protein GLUTAMINE DUMPER 2-like n=1 Tax=Phragmites australis TaxID=29695 RepID=UPI002D766F7E|nr:protein GLUTAMINE DUMPER 2-like [Phragmites australis]